MNKQEIQKEIAECRERLESLEAKLNEPEKFKLWKPQCDDKKPEYDKSFYVVDSGLSVSFAISQRCAAVNNCFKTREQAEKRAKWLIAYNELLALAEQLNDGWTPDWFDSADLKYHLYYDRDVQKWSYSWYRTTAFAGVYFKDKGTAQLAVDTLSEEAKEVLKYGYSGF